jgi:hypothetical protein
MLLRVAVGGGFALAGLRLFLPPVPIADATVLLVWLAFALGIGYGFATPWALPLAFIPSLGIWYTRATGPEYLGYGDASWLASALLILAGLCAISVGMGLYRGALRAITRHRARPTPPSVALLLAPALSLLLCGAAIDLLGGRTLVRRPRPIEVRHYSDSDLRAAATGIPFALYGATMAGEPNGISRNTSAPPGSAPTETFTVIYCDARCRRASEVQIQSAPPGFHRAREEQPIVVTAPKGTTAGTAEKIIPPVPFELVEVAGVSWRVVASGPQPGDVAATADLAGASVQIRAPGRAAFERVAANLRQIAPAP